MTLMTYPVLDKTEDLEDDNDEFSKSWLVRLKDTEKGDILFIEGG